MEPGLVSKELDASPSVPTLHLARVGVEIGIFKVEEGLVMCVNNLGAN